MIVLFEFITKDIDIYRDIKCKDHLILLSTSWLIFHLLLRNAGPYHN